MEHINKKVNQVLQQGYQTPEPDTSTPQPTKISPNPSSNKAVTLSPVEGPYDYEKVFEFLLKKGKQDFGANFIIQDADKPIITKLLAYFLKDEFMCLQHKISLQKAFC